MLVLIEGIDRTGKSSLADRLALFMGGQIVHFSKPDEHPLFEYTAPLTAFRPASETIIFDRGHIGESVWPFVFDRKSLLDEPMRRWLNMFYMSRGAVLLHAVRDVNPDTAAEYEAAGEPIYHLGDIDYAARLFRDAVTDTGLPVWEYEHGGWPGAALHVGAARSIIAGELADVTPRWVGSPAPRLMVVGSGEDGKVFPFMPYEDSDGSLLMNELDMWKQTALVNAVRPNGMGIEPVREMWFALGKPKVVTLGSAAANIVRSMNIPCEEHYGALPGWARTSQGSLRESLERHL